MLSTLELTDSGVIEFKTLVPYDLRGLEFVDLWQLPVPVQLQKKILVADFKTVDRQQILIECPLQLPVVEHRGSRGLKIDKKFLTSVRALRHRIGLPGNFQLLAIKPSFRFHKPKPRKLLPSQEAVKVAGDAPAQVGTQP